VIGLVVLVVGVIYLALLIWATRASYRWAKGKGFSKSRCWASAAGGFLVVYLPVFWDHIPTLISYQYSCAADAGFWEYKTIDQWKRENQGVAETLIAVKGLSPSTRSGDMQNFTDTYRLNQRFSRVSRKTGPLPINRWRWDYEIVDTKTGEVLSRSVDFSTGNGFIGGAELPMKFWLQLGYCKGGAVYLARQSPVQDAWKNIGQKE
jgi:hypothetical protein